MPASIFGNPAAVIQLNQALFGIAPGNGKYTNQLAQANSVGSVAFARQLGQTVATSNDALATTVLANVGINNPTLKDALVQAFAAFPNDRGVVILNLTNILTTLEGNAVYGAAAAQFNAQVATDFQYSTNPVNTTDSPINAGTVTLTANTDTVSGNVFEAGLVFTPGGNDRVNSLQDEDRLTGTGTNPTLNVTFGNPNDNGAASITPTLNGVQTVNVAFSANAGAVRLDLQDATGLTNAVNISRVSDTSNNVQVDNLLAAVNNLSVANSNSGTATIGLNFAAGALAGAADATTLTLSRVNVVGLSVEDTDNVIGANTGAVGLSDGYETINLVSAGSPNAVGTFSAEDLRVLNISGASNLTLGATNNVVNGTLVEAVRYNAGLANVAGSLTTVNASTFTGNLDYTVGAEIVAVADNTSGVPVNLSITGGSGNDTFRLALGSDVQAPDRIDGGMGNNTLVVLGTTAVAGTVSNVQNLEIRSGHDADAAADVVNVNSAVITNLVNTFIRNEGQTGALGANSVSVSEDLVARVVNMTAAQAANVTTAHGTTGNNDLAVAGAPGAAAVGFAGTRINLDVGAGVTTAAVTLVDGINNDPRYNFSLVADSDTEAGAASANGLQANNRNNVNTVANVTITDNDSESQTIELVEFGRLASDDRGIAAGHSGTITLVGGRTGQFLNLDATANAYRYDLTGGNTDGGTGGQPANSNGLATNGHRSDVGAGYAERLIATNITATGYVGDVIVRVADSDTALGAQNIQMGVGNDTVIFDQINVNAVNRRTAGLSISDTVNGGAGTDILGLDGNGVSVSIGASEWTNVSNFEIIRLIGNGVAANNNPAQANSYNLTLTNDLLAANGVTDGGIKRIIIVNDNDSSNDVVGVADDANGRAATFGASGVEGGVTINASSLNSNVSFQYNGEEGASRTADRFIFSDANINGTAIIDGGRVYGANNTAINTANADVLQVLNSAVVTLGDLAGIRNVGTLQFSNISAIGQSSLLELNNDTLDRLVNDGRLADTANRETLTVQGFDNPNVAGAVTNLTIDAVNVTTGAFGLNVTTQAGTDRVLINAVSAGPGLNFNLGGQAAGTFDTVELRNGAANETYGFTAAGDLRITSADGLVTRTVVIDGVERVDITALTNLSVAQKAALVALPASAKGAAFFDGGAGGPVVVPPVPGGNVIAINAGSVAPVAGTAAADVFTFAPAAARATNDNTVVTVNAFTAAADSFQFDLVTALGNRTLAQLNGVEGIVVQTNPITNQTVVSFGPDGNGDLIALTLVGVADPALVNVNVV